MSARLSRLALPTALVRALELSRHHDYAPIDVIEESDGYRVVWLGVLSREETSAARFVAEVKAVRPR